MKEKSIIIGAGMGGLSAAIRCFLAGYQVKSMKNAWGNRWAIKPRATRVGPTIVMTADSQQSTF